MLSNSKIAPTISAEQHTSKLPLPSLPSERVVGEIEEFLRQMIRQMPPDPQEMERNGPGRPRIMPSMCLWAGLLVCVLQGLGSQRALWRLLNKGNFWFYPRMAVSDQAVYKRLEEGGATPMQRLFQQVSMVLAQRLAPFESAHLAPFASGVGALDQSTLDQVARTLPALRGSPPADPLLLPGKLSALYNIRQQQWKEIKLLENPTQNEKVAARDTLERLIEEGVEEGSLILADLGYFGFEWFDWLTDHKMWWVSRFRARTSFEVIHRFYTGEDEQGRPFSDNLVWLGAYRADRAAHAVRMVTFWQGTTEYSHITSVLDPHKLSMLDIAGVYARRWDIEMAFKLVKRYLGLHMLWSAKPVIIQQQVWAVLIISQIMQAFQMEIAARAGVDPFEVSMPLLVEYMPRFVYTGEDPVTVFVQQGRELGFIRPSRRTIIRAPAFDAANIMPVPPELLLLRQPRYSHRNCASRHPLRN